MRERRIFLRRTLFRHRRARYTARRDLGGGGSDRKVLVIGAAGMVGRMLARHLLDSGKLGDSTVTDLTAFDVVPADLDAGSSAVRLSIREGDIADPATVDQLIGDRPDVIFHLAAV